VAEHDTETDTRTGERQNRETRANQLCCFNIHFSVPFS
jgi:hypothetical protein